MVPNNHRTAEILYYSIRQLNKVRSFVHSFCLIAPGGVGALRKKDSVGVTQATENL